jgi:galactose-1-phosphate uridylyltransferase
MTAPFEVTHKILREYATHSNNVSHRSEFKQAEAEIAAAEKREAELVAALEKALLALHPFAARWNVNTDAFSFDAPRPAAGQFKRAYSVFEEIRALLKGGAS